MKKYYLLFILLACRLTTIACPQCEKAQPRILRGITHGIGPDSNWDFVIVWIAVIIVVITLIFSVKWLIQPGEKKEQHIKRMAINFE